MKSKTFVDSLAVVLPRYGESLGGGAEALTKALVEQLAHGRDNSGPLVKHIEVWTTCARDHRTWKNEFAPGITVEKGITVRRFSVDERNLDVFIKHEIAMSQGEALTVDEQLAWLSESVNSAGLYEHISAHGREFSAILFAPYLFATTYWGAHIHPDRSVIIPCLHNEPYAYQPVFGHLFSKVRGLLCNAPAERDLVLAICGENELAQKSVVVGMGFEIPAEESQPARAENCEPYLLYSGRKERGKNVDLLLSFFSNYAAKYPDDQLKLVFIGAGDLREIGPVPPNVEDRGFVSEEEKRDLLRNALCLCQPSTNESFSIVLMEAWLENTPALVHGKCAVTREHVVQSGGGLYFTSAEEFTAVVHELRSSSLLRDTLGCAGRDYVARVYSWEAVLARLQAAFIQFGLVDNGKSETTNIGCGSC